MYMCLQKYAYFFQDKCMDGDVDGNGEASGDDGSGDGWFSGDDDDYDEYIPPRLLLGVRLFMLNGSVDIGYVPTTDGYGNADAIVTIIINYGREFLVLNRSEATEFFFTIYRWYHYLQNNDPRRTFNGYNDHLIGNCVIRKHIGEMYSITFTSNEGEIQTINKFKHEDMLKIYEMRWIIDGRIDFMQSMARDIIDEIEKYADKYRDNPQQILHDSHYYSCDGIVVEIACNFMEYFLDFIVEKNNAVDDEQQQE